MIRKDGSKRVAITEDCLSDEFPLQTGRDGTTVIIDRTRHIVLLGREDTSRAGNIHDVTLRT